MTGDVGGDPAGAPDDLSAAALAAALPDRLVRTYPAVLSTEADASAWARADAPEGAVVVADYQASPRGRAGWPWTVEPGRGLSFSIVLRPRLAVEREGWVYTVATTALADLAGADAKIVWPDEVRRGGERVAAVGAQVTLGPHGVDWAVVNVLIEEAPPPRAPLLARAVEAIEARHRAPSSEVLREHIARCETLGHTVRARMIPMGPGGPQVTGEAVTTLKDGALVVKTDEGRRIAVRPQNLGLLDDPAPPPLEEDSVRIHPTSSG